MVARVSKLQQSAHTRPLRDLETDGSKVVEELRASSEPVVLTEDGRPAAVLMTAEQFEELEERGRFVAAVAQGLADEEAGHVMTTAEMKAALERKHGPIPWK